MDAGSCGPAVTFGGL